jgi:hypothetical protein
MGVVHPVAEAPTWERLRELNVERCLNKRLHFTMLGPRVFDLFENNGR